MSISSYFKKAILTKFVLIILFIGNLFIFSIASDDSNKNSSEIQYDNNILKAEVTIGNKKRVFYREPGIAFMLNSQEFISQLSKEAERLGAIIQTDDKVRSVNDLDGKYIIDASGCPSSIKREFGFNKGLKGVTYQQTLEDSNNFISNTIKLLYNELA